MKNAKTMKTALGVNKMEQKPKTIFIDITHTFDNGSTGTCRVQHNELFDGAIQRDKYKVVEYTDTYEVLQPIKNKIMENYTIIRGSLLGIKDNKIEVMSKSTYMCLEDIYYINCDCNVTDENGHSVTAKEGDYILKFFPERNIDKSHSLIVVNGDAAKALKARIDALDALNHSKNTDTANNVICSEDCPC